MTYKISKEDLKDLESIWLYTYENWSAEQADRYYNLLIDEIEYLAEHPNAGKNYEHFRKGYFRSKVNFHFIFYKVSLKENELEIIRILHQQMDIDSRLNE